MFDIITLISTEPSIVHDIFNSQYFMVLSYFQVNLHKINKSKTPRKVKAALTINV